MCYSTHPQALHLAAANLFNHVPFALIFLELIFIGAEVCEQVLA